ncbi:unnamed protein product, partial [Cladocopium goreaui]
MPELRNQLEICLYALTLLSLLRTAHAKEPPLLRDWTRVDDDELDETHEVFAAVLTDNDDVAVLVARCLLDCDAGKFRSLSSSIVVLRDSWDRFRRRQDPLPDVVLQRTLALERRMAHNRSPVSLDAVYRSLEMLHAVSRP